jgi:predicted DNA-binding transcriptional regulator YafY
LNLTPAEATALAIALASARAMPFAEAGRSALTKLAAVMAAAPREAATELVQHIRVIQDPGDPVDQVAQVLQQALLGAVAVELIYRDQQDNETVRVVEPAGLFGTSHGWYLAAWCRLRLAPRSFRLDRIAQATLTREAITPRSLDAMLPDIPFDLTEPFLS